jgi:hypothetical protein
VTSRTGASSGTCNLPHQLPNRDDDRASEEEALRHRGAAYVPLEASLDRDATIPRVNVDHSDVAQYCATATVRACCFGTEGTKVCIVRFEGFEEIVASLGCGE